MSRETELLEKVEEWQNKAKRETDPFNKYVSIFIAYNIFYNLYAKKKTGNFQADFSRSDSKRATATVSLVKADELFKTIEADLKEYTSIIPIFREEYWPTRDLPRRVPISQTLKASFLVKDAKKTIDMLIKWLYKVRCNLVHGEKSYSDTQQRKLLETSTILLDKILKHLRSRYEQAFGHRD